MTGRGKTLLLVALALGDCGDPCVVRYSNGGVLTLFEQAADEIRERGALIIDGECSSACLLLADRARPNVCITDRAVFFYHQTSYDRPLPLSHDIDNWIVKRGGYPKFDGKPAKISNGDAMLFWKKCSTGSNDR